MDLLLILGLTAAALWLAWIGHLGSDDKVHLQGAIGWLTAFPYAGQNHGEMRHLITLPAALSLRILGLGEFAAVLPNLLYYGALVGLSFVFIRRRWGRATAYMFCAIVLSMPIFSLQATMVFSDTTELFFAALSFGFFLRARERPEGSEGPNTRLHLALSGACAALALLTRETTLALLMAYAVFFVFEREISRRHYLWLAAGLLAVLLLEALLMWAVAGNPWHRYALTLAEVHSLAVPAVDNSKGLIDRIGNVRVNYLVDPFLVPLINHEFGIFWWLAVPVMWLGWRRASLFSKDERRVLLQLVVVSVLWFAVAMTLIKEYRHPRYIAGATYAMALVMALVLARLAQKTPSRLPQFAAATVVAVGVLCIYIDNRAPLFGERALLSQLQTLDEVVYTDKETAGRLKLLLYFKGWQGKVVAAEPAPGALYFVNPNRQTLAPGWKIGSCAALLHLTTPPITAHGKLLDSLGLSGFIPVDIYRRLAHPNREVSLLRLSSDTAHCPVR